MELRLEYKAVANCHPEDLWEIFRQQGSWQECTGIFGQSGWVHGEPWQPASRFVIELMNPFRVDLEVVVLRCTPPREVVLLCHGAGLAGELWVHFRPEHAHISNVTVDAAIVGSSKLPTEQLKTGILQILDDWFEGIANEAVKHCKLVLL